MWDIERRRQVGDRKKASIDRRHQGYRRKALGVGYR